MPEIGEIVATDTVATPTDPGGAKLRVLSVAPVFSEAIRRNFRRQSIGNLFEYDDGDS